MKVLVIDDNMTICLTLKDILMDEGYDDVAYVNTVSDAMSILKLHRYDLIFLDIWLPDGDGIDVLSVIAEKYPLTDVVMITGHGSVEHAVKSIKIGAFDFLEKPFSLDRITILLKHIRNNMDLRSRVESYRQSELQRYRIVGDSFETAQLLSQIGKVAPTLAWCLILGENGTGKEHVSHLIHLNSTIADADFVEVNCAAIPKELIESEFFGHEKGAFTGADKRKIGKLELANGGTLFLDEIGDMGLETQAKLLRALENKSFYRVGGSEKIHSEFRLICATNKNLEKEIEEGRFREDLYYRIKVIPINVLPLRERMDDVDGLINFFISDSCNKYGLDKKKIDPEAVELLKSYSWPGNIRELKKTVERMVILSDDQTLTKNDIPPDIHGNKLNIGTTIEGNEPLSHAKKIFEKKYISMALEKNGGNISKTAETLGIARTYLHKKIKDFEININ